MEWRFSRLVLRFRHVSQPKPYRSGFLRRILRLKLTWSIHRAAARRILVGPFWRASP